MLTATIAPAQTTVSRLSVTHPDATYASVATTRYLVLARLMNGTQATATLNEFDVLIPSHLGNDAIVRLLQKATGLKYIVSSKKEQVCRF